MGDVFRGSIRIKAPEIFLVGALQASEIQEFIAGVATLSFGSIPAGGVASAVATVLGLTAGHAVVLRAIANPSDLYTHVIAAAGTAGGILATATNPMTSALESDPGTFAFFAFRVQPPGGKTGRNPSVQ